MAAKKLILIMVGFFVLLGLVSATITIGERNENFVIDLITPVATNDTFLNLSDTPSSYTGAGGDCVLVKGTEDGLEFGACAGGGGDGQKTTNGFYLYNDTTTIFFNETQLNNTIDDKTSNFGNVSSSSTSSTSLSIPIWSDTSARSLTTTSITITDGIAINIPSGGQLATPFISDTSGGTGTIEVIDNTHFQKNITLGTNTTIYSPVDNILGLDARTAIQFFILGKRKFNIVDNQVQIGDAEAGVDYQFIFNGEDSTGVFKWKEDEDYLELENVLLFGGRTISFRTEDVNISSPSSGILKISSNTTNFESEINATKNITINDRTCYTPDCSSYIYHNGTGLVIQG